MYEKLDNIKLGDDFECPTFFFDFHGYRKYEIIKVSVEPTNLEAILFFVVAGGVPVIGGPRRA
jgi:hypothetical protein